MIKFKTQVYSWISTSIGEEKQAGRLVEKEVAEGTTVAGYFAQLAEKHPEFRRLIYDPEAEMINDEVVIIYNDRVELFSKIKDRVISEKDTLTLSPVLVGG